MGLKASGFASPALGYEDNAIDLNGLLVRKGNKLPRNINPWRVKMHYSEEEKEKWSEDWRRSGKSICAFTRENKLVRWTFTKWLKAARSSKESFVEITAAAILPLGPRPQILIKKGDVKIHMPLMLGSGELRAVMEALGVCRTGGSYDI